MRKEMLWIDERFFFINLIALPLKQNFFKISRNYLIFTL